MNGRRHLQTIILFLYLIPLVGVAQSQIKVACVGTSITYGAGIVNREKNNYPQQLQVMLGNQYAVKNFGVSGTTILQKGDYPYSATQRHHESIEYNPDIVIIEFGTNDSKPQNRIHKDEFERDYQNLINSYKRLPSKPRIILTLPIKCYLKGSESISDSIIHHDFVPIIKQLAHQHSLELVDLYNIWKDRWIEHLMPDRLHPSSIGAGHMAEEIYAHLKNTDSKQVENKCSHPVCGNEFRSAAGWIEGSDWHTVSEDINSTLEGRNLDILFLGNSITQGLGGQRKLVTYKPALEVANQILASREWESAGISGDKTQNLLWRVSQGIYEKTTPTNVVIVIGINNLSAGDNPLHVAEGIYAVASECKKRFTDANIILLGVFPAGKESDDTIRLKCNEVHSSLAKYTWGDIRYINPSSWFVNRDGSLKEELYAKDYLHLSANGYHIWCTNLKELLN